MDYNATVQWLESNGWKEYPVNAILDNCDRQWFKRFPDEPRSYTNEDKPLSVCCKLWDNRRYGDSVGVQLRLRGEPIRDGISVIFEAYSIESFEDIPRHCETLFKAWRAVAS